MEGIDISSFAKERLIIEKDRVLTYSKLICPFECLYCFTEDLDQEQSKDTVYLSEAQFKLLQRLPENIKTIMIGCDTEFFQDKKEAISTLDRLSNLGKDISVVTKMSLDEETISAIKNIHDKITLNGNLLVLSVSVPCFNSSLKWEPRVPRVASRIEGLKKLSKQEIPAMVAIRPLIPDLETSEIDEIVEKTSPYAFGYYSGPLYLKNVNDDLLSREKLDGLGVDIEEVEPSWMPKGNKFVKLTNSILMSHLREKVIGSGKQFFEGAAQGIDFLRNTKK